LVRSPGYPGIPAGPYFPASDPRGWAQGTATGHIHRLVRQPALET